MAAVILVTSQTKENQADLRVPHMLLVAHCTKNVPLMMHIYYGYRSILTCLIEMNLVWNFPVKCVFSCVELCSLFSVTVLQMTKQHSGFS